MNSMSHSAITGHQKQIRQIADKYPVVSMAYALANEKWQNFPEDIAKDENWAVSCMTAAWGSSPFITINSCPPGSGESAEEFVKMINGFFACNAVHGTRNFGDMEFVMRRFFNYGYERYPEHYHGKRYGQFSLEPGGPGQGVTVGNTSETWKIVGMHLATLIGRSAIEYMSGRGVYWDGPIEEQPGFYEVGKLKSIFVPNSFQFSAYHGNRGEAWFTSTYGFADKGEGYGRVDQLISDNFRKGYCIAHSGKGRRQITSRRTCDVKVYDLALREKFDLKVTAGIPFDVQGDAFFVANLV
jgi:hypothetical protein